MSPLNERRKFDRSQAFMRRLEEIVPGGAHTYSKGRDQFPEQAPSGIQRGKGARVWDIDGNELVDWTMGLGSISLGHAFDPVDDAVCAAVRNGVNFQRPAQVEMDAAESFVALTGCDMVKFAKHGSVVTTAAVKLARAFTGRSKVAVVREHPFFSFDDWFIGTTPADFGIPDVIKQFTLLFSYNDLQSLEDLFKSHPDEIACVMLEPVKFDPPKEGFLAGVRGLCDRYGAVLVFDEMVTGLKFGIPGAASRFGVDADLYTYGKGIANGFAATALAGRREIMQLGGIGRTGERKMFLLSTTHGAESSGLAAMMATIDQFRDGKIVHDNWERGEDIRRRMNAIIKRHNLGDFLKISGYPCLLLLETLGPDGKSHPAFRTLFLQEAIAAGLLFQGLFLPGPCHGEAEIEVTERAFDHACSVYRAAIDRGSVQDLLIGEAVKPVFRRLV
jgi:glutamate-1-semialdehyde 2,1-aminomutase